MKQQHHVTASPTGHRAPTIYRFEHETTRYRRDTSCHAASRHTCWPSQPSVQGRNPCVFLTMSWARLRTDDIP